MASTLSRIDVSTGGTWKAARRDTSLWATEAVCITMEVQDVATLFRMRSWGWAHMWHTQISRDPRGYMSQDARVEAVLALDAAVDSLDSVQQAVWRAKPFQHVGADIVDESPTMWSKSDERCDICHAYAEGRTKLMTCSGCGVTKYCSKKCQKAGWKSGHKQMCAVLKQIVTSGTS